MEEKYTFVNAKLRIFSLVKSKENFYRDNNSTKRKERTVLINIEYISLPFKLPTFCCLFFVSTIETRGNIKFVFLFITKKGRSVGHSVSENMKLESTNKQIQFTYSS